MVRFTQALIFGFLATSSIVGCASTEAPKETAISINTRSVLSQLVEDSYSFDKAGFEQALSHTRVFTERDLYLPKGDRTSELRANTAKGQQEVMVEHITNNLQNKQYFRIPFTLQVQRYNPDKQIFGVVISSNNLTEQGISSISTFDGTNHFSLVPYAKLWRTDGYPTPRYYTYNEKPLSLLPRFAVPEAQSRYKSGSSAIRDSVTRLDVPSSSTLSFDMNKPRNSDYTGNIKVYIKATPEQAQKWVSGKTEMVAYVKPAIIVHAPYLNDYAVIYNPNEDVYVTEADERIVSVVKGTLK
jgi:hypothetical protein